MPGVRRTSFFYENLVNELDIFDERMGRPG
jgi:hypothetical protein